MTNLQNLTVEQLRRVVAIKEQIEGLESQLNAIAGGGTASRATKASGTNGRRGGRRVMSDAAKARIAAAQRARWAKLKGRGGRRNAASTQVVRRKKKRVVDAATRARLAAAARARWAKAKAAGKSSL